MKAGLFAIAVSAGLLGGCAHQAAPIAAGSYDVVTSYSHKLPGKYLLYVGNEQLDTVVRPQAVACSAHSFPIQAAEGFKGSVRGTLANLVENIELVDAPIPADQLKARGARGLIIVRADNLDGHLRVEPGFWSANMATEVRITASVTVDGSGGRLYGSTFEGLGKGDAGAGAFCEGGAVSMKESTEKAMREVVRKIGEGVSNSDRVRSGKSS
jgi:hypothetical protein